MQIQEDVFNGCTAIITGSCGDGIGRSAAMLLGSLGCNIVLNYGTYNSGTEYEKQANKVAEAINNLGGRAIIAKADTKNEDEVRSIVDKTLQQFGSVDFLIINSGSNWNARDVVDIPYFEWKNTLSAEIDAVFLLFKNVAPIMRKKRSGRIIILGLSNALNTNNLNNMAFDYRLGRAVRSWISSSLGHLEYPEICINVIEPGYIEGLSFKESLECIKRESEGHIIENNTPTCHDVAKAIVFLCSPFAKHISQSIIHIPTHILPVDR